MYLISNSMQNYFQRYFEIIIICYLNELNTGIKTQIIEIYRKTYEKHLHHLWIIPSTAMCLKHVTVSDFIS